MSVRKFPQIIITAYLPDGSILDCVIWILICDPTLADRLRLN
jgi:hypothetical protein